MRLNWIRAAAALTAAVAFTVVAQAADKVHLTNKQTLTGQVLKDNAEGVILRSGGGTVEYSRDQVAWVEYNGTPNDYDTGRTFFRSGNYNRAIEYLESARQAKHPALLRQYILYYIATCYQKSNDPDAAIPAFEEIFGQGTESRFLYEAVESLIELYCDAGRIADARAMLRKLPSPKTQAEKINRLLLEAAIEEKDKDFRRALQLYERAKTDAGATQREEAAKAALGMARCSVAMQKYEQAERDLTNMLKALDLGDLYPQAYVILGDAIVAGAKTDGDYERAILAYLRVPALYAGNEATEAKALFEAARTYQRVKGNEDAKNRAGKLFRMLRDRYPNSPYAEESPR